MHSSFDLRYGDIDGQGKFGIKRGTAHFVFHEPVDPKDFATREELSAAVREAIASGLPESMRG